jgi:hypothetical protein
MRPKKPESRSILILRNPGRNNLSWTTPFFTLFALASFATAIALSSRSATGFSQ